MQWGRVVTAEGREAIAGATVDFDGSSTVVTDREGRFLLPPHLPAYVLVNIHKAGRASRSFRVTVSPREPGRFVGDYALHPGVWLTGRVWRADGQPASSGRVFVRDRGYPSEPWPPWEFQLRASVAVGPDGRFEIGAEGPRVELQAVIPGHRIATRGLYRVADLVDRPDAIEFRLDRGVVQEGRVLDLKGEPIEGALVTEGPGMLFFDSYPSDRSTPWSTRTDENGAFSLAGLRPQGDLRLVCFKPGFEPIELELQGCESMEPCELRLRRGVEVVASLRSSTVDPIDEGYLALVLDDRAAVPFVRVGERFRTPPVVNPPSRIWVETRGTRSPDLTWEDDGNGRGDLGEVLLEPVSWSPIEVRDEEGQPIPAALARFHPIGWGDVEWESFSWVQADGLGRTRVPGPAFVSAPGFATSYTGVFDEDDLHPHPVILQKEASVVFRVVDPEGKPVAGADVWIREEFEHYNPSGRVRRLARTDDSGRTHDREFVPGNALTYWVRAPQFIEVESECIAPRAGESLEVDVELERGATLSVRALDPAGLPVDGLDVSFDGDRGETDEFGRFEFPPREPVSDQLVCGQGLTAVDVAIEVGMNHETIVVPGTDERVYRNRVVDSTGAPIEGVLVWSWTTAVRTDSHGEFELQVRQRRLQEDFRVEWAGRTTVHPLSFDDIQPIVREAGGVVQLSVEDETGAPFTDRTMLYLIDGVGRVLASRYHDPDTGLFSSEFRGVPIERDVRLLVGAKYRTVLTTSIANLERNEVRRGAVRLVRRPDGRTISVQLVDSEGEPCSDELVEVWEHFPHASPDGSPGEFLRLQADFRRTDADGGLTWGGFHDVVYGIALVGNRQEFVTYRIGDPAVIEFAGD